MHYPVKYGDGIVSIEFAPPNERARKVVSRSNTRPTGKFPSRRMGRMIHWDSPHELNAYRLLESNPSVLSFREQPCVIHYQLDGQVFRHYPDCLVETHGAKALWEVKTAADARRPEVAIRTRFLVQHAPTWGYEYAVVLAEDLARQPRMKNVRYLLRHGRIELTFEQKEFARRLFASTFQISWADVLDDKYQPFTMQQACRLVLDGALYLDLDAPVKSDTQLVKVPGATLFGESHG